MQTIFERYKKMRIYLLESIKDLNTDQLNKIPTGFSNNIIWNVAHLVVTQQIICYRRAGKELHIDNDFFEQFKPGSKPNKYIDEALIEKIKHYFISHMDLLETDYNNNVFADYQAWNTRYGAELIDIDKALAFLPYHEGLHQGHIDSLKKFVV